MQELKVKGSRRALPRSGLVVVEDFKSFADAVANKLAKEIDVADRSAVGRISSRPSQ
jgi:hypothetical protein